MTGSITSDRDGPTVATGDPTPGALTAAATASLRRWTAPDADQEGLREAYLDHLRRHPDGWSRQCRGAHLTASSLICAVRPRLVLLSLHARLGRWLQTGGHLEPDDTSVEAAALREATEESGVPGLRLHPDPLLLSRHPLRCGGQPTYHLDVQYLVTVEGADPPQPSAESVAVSWFAPDALPEVDASVRQLVDAAAARLAW